MTNLQYSSLKMKKIIGRRYDGVDNSFSGRYAGEKRIRAAKAAILEKGYSATGSIERSIKVGL